MAFVPAALKTLLMEVTDLIDSYHRGGSLCWFNRLHDIVKTLF